MDLSEFTQIFVNKLLITKEIGKKSRNEQNYSKMLFVAHFKKVYLNVVETF